MQIRLAVLLQDLEFGGTQRYAVHLLKHLNREIFSPELWVLRGGSDMLPAARDTGVDIFHLSQSSWVSPEALVRLAWKLFRERPHMLYTLTVVPNIWGRVFGRMARVPVIVSGYRSLFPNQHERWLWRLSNRIICNAQALKGVMMQRYAVPSDRIAVVPNAVDTDYFRPEAQTGVSNPTVLSIGRLVDDKDPLNLLEGFRLAAGRLHGAHFEIMGNGSFKPEVESRIRAHCLESRIKLLAGATDVRPAMRRASVFVLASVREASPNVIIEAMAMGLPVVATRVGGIPELVLDGKTGILVEPGDPVGLADALVAVLTDEERRREMGLNGRKRVETFHSLEYMTRETERVLLDAAEANV
ncbi:MAG TPA: glycosyltransferase [Desulfomonilaceae bacterium]|nr:glycosyltransferase [Desulfomonilaceae bacterium]